MSTYAVVVVVEAEDETEAWDLVNSSVGSFGAEAHVPERSTPIKVDGEQQAVSFWI